MSLVCLSASYGAGGGWIGPALAERLGVPFLDRAIHAAVAEQLQVSIDDVAALDEQPPAGWLERLLTAFNALDVSQPTELPVVPASASDFRRATEQALRRHAASGHGVILGRAAMIVLREHPRAMFVRLHGCAELRVEQAMRLQGIDRETANRRLQQLDRTHAAYLKQYYGANVHDCTLYHLVLDSTRIELPACVDMLVAGAHAFHPHAANSTTHAAQAAQPPR